MFKSSADKLGIFAVVAIGLLALALAAAGPFVASAAIIGPQAQNQPPVATASPQTQESTPAAKVESEETYTDLFIRKFASGWVLIRNQDGTAGALNIYQAIGWQTAQAEADVIAQKMGPEGLRMLVPVSEIWEVVRSGRDQFYVDLKLMVAHAFSQALGISDQELQVSGRAFDCRCGSRPELNLDQ
jgi:hypothetical protein